MSEFDLSFDEKVILLEIARNSILKRYSLSPILPPEMEFPRSLELPCGAFVTIHVESELRGCYGRMISSEPLFQTVEEMAVWAATKDYRFKSIKQDEINLMNIEISVLSPLKLIDNIAEIKLGVHGILIRKGSQTGVFLPQVATETDWTLEEFLGHCSRDKAGIGWDGWNSAEIYIFTATVFSE